MKFLQQISRATIAIVLLALPLGVITAQSRDYVCSTSGYTIATINGIFTDKDGAISNKDALKDKLPSTHKNEKLTVDFLLNPPHLAGIGDLVTAAYQKAFENEGVRDYDLVEMLRSANEKIKTQKLLLVAHSQGNFYANSFYDTVVNDPESISAQSLGVYAVATPASKVAGSGKWITSGTDNTIVGYVGGVLHRKILPPNVYIKEFGQFSTQFDYGHSFVDAYLKYEGTRIVSDIKESLSKLSADENRRGDAPCIGAPTITTAHNIEGAILAVLDHPLDTLTGAAQNAAYASTVTGKSAFYAISFLAKTTERLASAAISSSLSVYRVLRNNSNDTVNNSASVLLATTPQQESAPISDPTKAAEPIEATPISQTTNQPVISETITPSATAAPTQPETLSAQTPTTKIALADTNTATLSGFDLGGGVGPVQATENNTSTSNNQSSQTETNNSSTPDSSTGSGIATSSADTSATTTPATLPPNPPAPAATTTPKTIFFHPYIGTSIEVGNLDSASNVRSFANPNLAEDIYSIRIKKASNFDCQKDVGPSYISAGYSDMESRIVQLDTSSAITDGQYCEYSFTNDYHGPYIKAGTPINKVYFSTKNYYDYLDGSIYNDGSSTNTYGIKTMSGGYAFELCGTLGCSGLFKFPPDGVVPNMPSRQTYLHAPKFSGTYNNNATFNKIVFELKNTTTGTELTIERPAQKTGSVVPYSEQIDLLNGGEWQYRVRLEDSINASSTPWSPIATFTFTPRTLENQKNAKTLYANPYIGTPIDVGSSSVGNSSIVSFTSSSRSDDAYSIRFKKSSNFDCRGSSVRGSIISGYSPTAKKIVDLDPVTATNDGSYCEYTFTDDQTAIRANTELNYLSFLATQNGEHVFLDGSPMNNGRTMGENGIWYAAPTYAFQLCNLFGCNEEFKTFATTSASSTLSSGRTITSFLVGAATSTLSGVIDEASHTITLTVPFGTDIKTLTTTVVASPLATLSPASGVVQDFTNPVAYTVMAEDGSTQTYLVTVVIAPNATPPTITSYTFNGIAGDITVNLATTTELITPPVTINLTANKNVDWVSVTIEDQSNPSNYKRFLSGVGCVDGTTTCEKPWDGKLSHGTTTPNSIYRVKAHLKDTAGNEYNDYLLPYRITINY